MGLQNVWYVLLWPMVALLLLGNAAAQLKAGYYSTCPQAERVARVTLAASLLTDVTAPGALLRLVFHDCRVQACDASILLDSNGAITSEMVSGRNFGIRRLDLIDRVKAALDRVCPNTVSCADVIAMVGRDVVSISGGPSIPILLGRRDAVSASNLKADSQLPPATVSVDGFLSVFQSFGMNLQESVAIMGAHTLGVGHCVNVNNRLYPQQDPNLKLPFSLQLRAACPTRVPFTNITFIPIDSTNVLFDNRYFKDLLNGRGLFTIDSELALDPRTMPIVAEFAGSQQLFFDTFTSAFLKLTSANVLTGSAGQIRTNCHQVNPS